MSKSRNAVLTLGFWALIGMIIWPVALSVGPRLEGQFFPAVGSAQITRIVDTGGGSSDVWGRALKLRDECQYLSTEWYFGTYTKYVLAPLLILEAPKVRSGGWFDFGPWRVGLPRDDLRERSFVIVKHRCHAFWVTETPFWP